MQDSADDCDAYHTFDPTRSQTTINKNMVQKLMALIENSLSSKLDAIETLIAKNNRNLARATQDFKKIEDVVTTFQRSNKSQCLSDEIRLLFALARSDRLDLVGKVASIDQAMKASQRTPAPSRSRSPMVLPGNP
jgi:hypothetical protein